MKKTHISAILAAALMLALLTGCGKTAPADVSGGTSEPAGTSEAAVSAEGVLAYLNLSEEEYQDYLDVRTRIVDVLKETGYVKDNAPGEPKDRLAQTRKVVYYDSLDAMQMALNAGEIDSMEVFQSTARYLCAQDSGLVMPLEYDLEKERVRFAKAAMGSITTGFAFMMMEDNGGLLESFNGAIAAMTEDGTLEQLVSRYIKNVTAGTDIQTVQPEQADGRDTLKVAVTGSLPPFDYVSADGTPAGFNTAVLAEIGRRLDVNVELVQVDNAGRASALASGVVDVVFWTRSAPDGDMFHVMSEGQFKDFSSQKKANFSEQKIGILNALDEVMSREKAYNMDMPAGTVISDPYYADVVVPVVKQATLAD